jgi:hypothetical protein
MAFLRISDLSCEIDTLMMFPDEYEKFKSIMEEEEVYLFRGMRELAPQRL